MNNHLNDEQEIIKQQIQICKKFDTEFVKTPLESVIGIALESLHSSIFPVNGLRHPKQSNMAENWYLWAGEYSGSPDFFKPVHVKHLLDICPKALKYLGLPPGWRFLFDTNYEDVWFDKSLLNI